MGRNSKRFQRRKAVQKWQLARRGGIRKLNKRILIVCEGEKTEPAYFRAVVEFFGLTAADVLICYDCDSAPKKIVSYAEKKARAEKDFDAVFCVFDRDAHDSFEEAKTRAQGLENSARPPAKIFKAITSIPCFELWFLLHFELHTKPHSATGRKSPCENLISTLKAKPGFKDYEKSAVHHFRLLKDRLPTAKKNAKQLLKSGRAAGTDNPSTLVHTLLEYLESAKREAGEEAMKSRSP